MRLCRKYGSEIAHDGQPEPTTENHSEKAKNPPTFPYLSNMYGLWEKSGRACWET